MAALAAARPPERLPGHSAHVPPTYDDLRAEGETLRKRVAELIPALIATALLIDTIRGWQLSCERTVAGGSPQFLTAFRVQTGPFQRTP